MHRYFFDALHSGFRIKSKIKYDLSECGYTSFLFVTRYDYYNNAILAIEMPMSFEFGHLLDCK